VVPQIIPVPMRGTIFDTIPTRSAEHRRCVGKPAWAIVQPSHRKHLALLSAPQTKSSSRTKKRCGAIAMIVVFRLRPMLQWAMIRRKAALFRRSHTPDHPI
jgi:hypothetical protein